MSQLQDTGLQPLFFSPLSMFQLTDVAERNAQLLAEARACRDASPGVNRSNLRGWHSKDDFFERIEPGSQWLQQQIIEAVRQSTLKIAPTFDFKQYGLQAEGWFNMLDKGGMNTPHDHPGWVWSGCYYVHVPEYDEERSGSIEFIDPRTNLRVLPVDNAACFASKFVMQPKSGMMLLFPSWLKHWVYPNESDETRISIAFNVRFAKR